MNTQTPGMLWFSNDPNKSLAEKVMEARQYYRMKYLTYPNLCLIHPGALINLTPPITFMDMSIRPNRGVLPGHLWIGVENENI
jgi:hypothetical protein